MSPIHISEFMSEHIERNYDRTSSWAGPRCELCWKPLKDDTTHIVVNGDADLYLPVNENDTNESSGSVAIGKSCLKKLKSKKLRAEFNNGYVVITK